MDGWLSDAAGPFRGPPRTERELFGVPPESPPGVPESVTEPLDPLGEGAAEGVVDDEMKARFTDRLNAEEAAEPAPWTDLPPGYRVASDERRAGDISSADLAGVGRGVVVDRDRPAAQMAAVPDPGRRRRRADGRRGVAAGEATPALPTTPENRVRVRRDHGPCRQPESPTLTGRGGAPGAPARGERARRSSGRRSR